MIAIYIRVSTREQADEGYSIASQREKLISFCKAMSWSNYKFYVDEGVSAKDMNRPELQRMLKDMRNGNLSMILVYRLDRFTRKVKDLHKMLDEMEQLDCAFKSATEPYDTSSAMGKLIITLIATIAEWETANSSERIKLNLEKKVSSGERVGGIPYPFDLGDDERLVINEKRSQVTLEMNEMVKSGMSSERVADYLTETNIDKPVWRSNTVLRILRNPALQGDTRWNDKVYKNTHKGIISEDELETIQQILKDRGTAHRRDVQSLYLFQGVIACPSCGSALNVNRFFRTRKDGSTYQGATYRCPPCAKDKSFNRTLGEQRILSALYEYMEDFTVDKIEQAEVKDDRSYYADQLEQIEKKREKYQRAWASDFMDDDEFKKLMDETRGIYDDLKSKVEQEPQQKNLNKEDIKNIVSGFNENFDNLTDDEKRVFISTFIRKIDFTLIPQPPKRPDRSKRGKEIVEVLNVDFY